MPVDPESLYARGLISDDRMDQLRETMTHQPEGANPAAPYIDAARKAATKGLAFATGGLTRAGVDVLPDWMNTVGGVFQNPDNQAVIGGGIGSGRIPKPFVPTGQRRLNRFGQPVFGNDPANREAVKAGLGAGKSYYQIGQELGADESAVMHVAHDLGLKSEHVFGGVQRGPDGKYTSPGSTKTISTDWVTLPDGTLGRRTGRTEDLR
jgi:hypothetical protein